MRQIQSKTITPHHSTKLNGDVDQLDWLRAKPRPQPIVIHHEVIVACKSLTAAIVLAQYSSQLEDKEIYIPLKIDKSSWSKMKEGKAFFPINLLSQFMDLVANDIPLTWLANHRGYKLEPLQTGLEAENAELRDALAKRDAEMEFLKKFLKDTGRA
jgi:hypothetical protein